MNIFVYQYTCLEYRVMLYFLDLPELILGVEKVELGISAGLQDRVIQVYGGLVHMDFSCSDPSARYTSFPVNLLPVTYLAYDSIAGICL